MLDRPYEILWCSWPRPVEEARREWVSAPAWDLPLSYLRPQPKWQMLDGEQCWTIDWRETFRGESRFGGEMRRFQVSFRIRINHTGLLRFREDDGSVIRLKGEIIHCDRTAHPPSGRDIRVTAGDHLDIAQWQLDGSWLWGARFVEVLSEDVLASSTPRVQDRLRNPSGPPLLMFSNARYPLRTLVAVYSMILNGYVPSAVFLYGEHQWSSRDRTILTCGLPFARIVLASDVLSEIREFGGAGLVEMAQHHWFVMKSAISLLCAPQEFCLMDDDVIVLDETKDALDLFRRADLVFTPDYCHRDLYASVWAGVFGRTDLCRSSNINTGLYWLRNRHDKHRVAGAMLRGRDYLSAEWAWEQGLFAHLFADLDIHCLPSQRYIYPLLDGLPGGIDGYDYYHNPCGFASIHFGGPVEKPTDENIRLLCTQILNRKSGAASDCSRAAGHASETTATTLSACLARSTI